MILKNLVELETIKTQIEKEINISNLIEMENGFEVTCHESASQALSMALQSRKLEQTLEKSRLDITKPHLEFQRSINKIIKDFKEKLESIEKRLQNKIELWMQKNNENPFSSIDAITVEDGTLYLKDEWDFEILDEKIIPQFYFKLDENKINESIKNGIRKIPGIKIFKKETTMMRIKN